MKNYLFTSESVTEGHPDKMCDKISDAILDEILRHDPESRVACETMITTARVVVSAEITTKAKVDYHQIIKNTLEEIGYSKEDLGAVDFSGSGEKKIFIETLMKEQSPHIAQGVDSNDNHEQGAGDQGLMFGYACNETTELMPMPIMIAHKLTRRLSTVRKANLLDFLRPDGKSQVTVSYHDGKPAYVSMVVISAQHDPDIGESDLREAIIEEVIKPIVPSDLRHPDITYHINPTGRFVIGGPQGDTGLTGRKIIADTYGGMGRHGGGAFSGKDPTKVDRSATYAARHVAKNIVAAKLAERCEVQISYAIGVIEPTSIMVETFGTGTIPDHRLTELVNKHFDLTPMGIIERLDLRKPIYKNTSAYGHFGREENGFTWELTDYAEKLKSEV